MDHALYDYSALPQRTAAAAGAGVLHTFVVLCLEHWDAEPAPGAVRDPRFVGEFGSFTPDYRSWTQREYGLRIGVFRVLDALRALEIPVAVAANARAVQRLPKLVKTLSESGCEWIGHGLSANDLMHSGMTRAEQGAHIAQSLQAIADHTGQRPQGWLSQDWGTSPDTYGLLAEAGIGYTLDWTNDDQPYPLHTEPPVLAIPVSAEWDDVQCQWLRQMAPRDHAQLALAAFDRLREECAGHRRDAVFGLCLHPWVCGMSSRIGALRELLARMRERQDVRWCLPRDIHSRHTNGATP